MSNEREPLGYLPCPECKKIRNIYQGTGKRAKYLFANGCNCKMDQRTGEEIQAVFQRHMPIEEAKAKLEAMLTPKPKEEDKPKEKSNVSKWFVGAVVIGLGVLGLRVRG